MFEIARVLVRLDHIASLHRKRESQRRDSGGAFFPSGKEQPPLKSTITGQFPPSAPDYLHWTICIGDVVVGIGLNILSHGCGTADTTPVRVAHFAHGFLCRLYFFLR